MLKYKKNINLIQVNIWIQVNTNIINSLIFKDKSVLCQKATVIAQ
jgi:hypothetical protein